MKPNHPVLPGSLPASRPQSRGISLTMQFLKDAWIFLPAIPYFVVVLQNAPNVPIMDDYDAILAFLNNWRGADLMGKLSLLFQQYNEHRLLHSRIVYVLYYSLFGNVDFRNLILLADLQLVIIASVSVYFIRKYAGKYWRMIAFLWTLCIFDLNTYESGSIAMYGMQNYGVIMLFFASLFLYDKSNKWLAAAAMLQALCIFSSGNGMIGAFFIVLFTLRSGDKLKKMVSILTAAICIPLYFLHYEFISQPDKEPFSISRVSVYFIRMSGAPFDFDNSLCFGLLILAGLIALLVIRPAKAPWPMLCILGFALASMGTSSLFRACLKDAQFQTSRYLIYPQLLIAVACLLVWLKMEKMQYKWAVLTVIAVGMLRIYSSNFEFGKLGFMRTTARAKAYIYWHPHKEAAKQISDSACQSGIYCLESEKNKLLSEAE